jgi:hypothetical protein
MALGLGPRIIGGSSPSFPTNIQKVILFPLRGNMMSVGDILKAILNKKDSIETSSINQECPHGDGNNCVRCFMVDIETNIENIIVPMDETDLMKAVRHLPEKIARFLKEFHTETILAGGYLRSIITNEEVNDYDIFCSVDKLQIKDNIYQSYGTWYSIKESANSWLCNDPSLAPKPVQFIHRWTFTDAKSLLRYFDFTIAKAAVWYDGTNWQGVVDKRFYQDLAAKRLVYESGLPGNEGASHITRVFKFIARGYTIENNDLANVLTWIINSTTSLGEIDRPTVKTEILNTLNASKFSDVTWDKLREPISRPKPKEQVYSSSY